MILEERCYGCAHGEVSGLSVKCRMIHTQLMVVMNNVPLLDHEIDYILVPHTFKCCEYKTKEDI